jgi:hypothetical protein
MPTPHLVSLYGFSTAGKSSLARLLAARRGFVQLSAGHFVKDRLIAEGFDAAMIHGNPPERDQPHPLAPLKADGTHMTPREHEIRTFRETPPEKVALLNRAAIESLLAEGRRVVFEGYRWPAQHLMLARLKASTTCLMALVESPQVPVPPPHAVDDDLCLGLAFDVRLLNDKVLPIEAALAQLESAMGRAGQDGRGG